MAVAAGIGAAGSLLSGITGGKAAKQAAQIQAKSQAASLAEQQRQYNQNQQNFAPYLSAGQNALTAQGNLLGLNGTGQQQSAITALQGSPLFTALDQSGQEALLQSAAATGGLRGGNTQSALYNNRANLLANVIQNQLANLGGVSSLGAGAAGTAGGLGQNNANAISGIYGQQGNSAATNALAQGAITGRTFNDLSSILQNALGSGSNNNAANAAFTSGFNSFQAGQNAVGSSLFRPSLSW